jgi:hypothetical protein
MRRGALRPLLAVPLALAVLASAGAAPSGGVQTASAKGLAKLDKRLLAHVSGVASLEFAAAAAAPSARAQTRSTYFPVGDDGCPVNLGDNVKVNQNCLNLTDADLQGRAQAQNETGVAVAPDGRHVVASYNDYRRGDGTCGTSYSLDAGRSWTDSTTPNGFTRGTPFGAARQYWQAGGDTSLAWDTKGNVYMACQGFNRGSPPTSNPDLSSAFLVFRSTRNNGASWSFTGSYATVANDLAASGAVLEDKALLTVDNHAGSPFQDRVYVTWTEFTATTAYIYEVASSDYGQTFGPRRLVSQASTLCPFPVSPKGGCDNNQGSQPFTGPDGTLYVVWSNFNTVDLSPANPKPARYQVLVAASKDGGATFSAPQRVGAYYELPDCPTYTGGQDPGRACLPEKGATSNSVFRATSYPSGAVNPGNPRQVAVSFGSYINRDSNESNGCVPTGTVAASQGGLYTGVKTPGACSDHILLSVSNDGGATFTGTTADPRTLTTVTSSRAQATTDQWFQGLAFTRDGRLAVSYYDRQYGNDETTGFSDFSLSGSTDLEHFATTRVTSSSMPPPTQFGGVFWGDYVTLDARDIAYPTWSDTRSRDLFLCPGTATGPGNPPQVCGLQEPNGLTANDQDIFAAGVEVPTPNGDSNH